MSKIILAQALSAFKASLKEVLIDPTVRCMKAKKQAQDQQVFQDWLDMRERTLTEQCMGRTRCMRDAHGNLAIETLLLRVPFPKHRC